MQPSSVTTKNPITPPSEVQFRFFQIAGITIKIEFDFNVPSDSPINFSDTLEGFSSEGPGDDNVTIQHKEYTPSIDISIFGDTVYNKVPWVILKRNDLIIYKRIFKDPQSLPYISLAFFSECHKKAIIYSSSARLVRASKDGFSSLSLFPTDQIWVNHLLADRKSLLLHSSAAIINYSHGKIFIGQSGAGKTTILSLLKASSTKNNVPFEILCDDRNIVKRGKNSWDVHGTWFHGDIQETSSNHAPIDGIYFLQQSRENKITPVKERKILLQYLYPRIVRSLVSSDILDKTLSTLECFIGENKFYLLQFDTSGDVHRSIFDNHLS